MPNLSTPQQTRGKNPTSPKPTEEDKVLDLTLRPKVWEDFVGQERIKQSLKIMIEAAQKRRQCPDHLLFYGGPGLGKTSLAYIIANEMGANIRVVSGPALEKPGDLVAILTNLSQGDILFLDESHSVNRVCEEHLYSAMEDFKLNIILGTGPMARTMELPLSPFTLVAATTRIALLSSPLRNRFGATFQIDFYKTEDIKQIIKRSAKILGVSIEPQAAGTIARRSRFTPRVANRLLKRVRDFAQVKGEGIITEEIAKKALNFLEIDEMGLETADRKILKTIIEKFNGGPVGLQALAATSSEEKDTILDIYEPYLMQLGFIKRTPKGRVALKSAYQHLNLNYPGPQNSLFNK